MSKTVEYINGLSLEPMLRKLVGDLGVIVTVHGNKEMFSFKKRSYMTEDIW